MPLKNAKEAYEMSTGKRSIRLDESQAKLHTDLVKFNIPYRRHINVFLKPFSSESSLQSQIAARLVQVFGGRVAYGKRNVKGGVPLPDRKKCPFNQVIRWSSGETTVHLYGSRDWYVNDGGNRPAAQITVRDPLKGKSKQPAQVAAFIQYLLESAPGLEFHLAHAELALDAYELHASGILQKRISMRHWRGINSKEDKHFTVGGPFDFGGTLYLNDRRKSKQLTVYERHEANIYKRLEIRFHRAAIHRMGILSFTEFLEDMQGIFDEAIQWKEIKWKWIEKNTNHFKYMKREAHRGLKTLPPQVAIRRLLKEESWYKGRYPKWLKNKDYYKLTEDVNIQFPYMYVEFQHLEQKAQDNPISVYVNKTREPKPIFLDEWEEFKKRKYRRIHNLPEEELNRMGIRTMKEKVEIPQPPMTEEEMKELFKELKEWHDQEEGKRRETPEGRETSMKTNGRGRMGDTGYDEWGGHEKCNDSLVMDDGKEGDGWGSGDGDGRGGNVVNSRERDDGEMGEGDGKRGDGGVGGHITLLVPPPPYSSAPPRL